MAQFVACASLWDRVSASTSERHLSSDNFTSRLIWFLRSAHHADISVLYDVTWPVGTENELISLKKRSLSDVAMGSVPISYKHTTRKISVIDTGLGDKLLAVVFSKLTDEGALADASRYLISAPAEEDGVLSFRNVAENSPSRSPSRSSSRSEKNQSVFSGNKFGIVFLMELGKSSSSCPHYKALEYFLCFLESELYAALVSSQNSSMANGPVFVKKANESFNRFVGNIRNLTRLQLINLPIQRRNNFADSAFLFIDLLMDCVIALEKKEMN